jgi:hypothetical protein
VAAKELVVAAAEIWPATKVSAALSPFFPPPPPPPLPRLLPQFLLLSHLAIVINAAVADAVAIFVAFYS